MVIAVDVDGTLYDGVEVPSAALDALRDARADGHEVVIVTGRRWEDLALVVPAVVELCELVVCEEGAVMVDVERATVQLLAEPVDEDLVSALRSAGVGPLDVGRVVIGAPTSALAMVTEVRDRLSSTRTISVNKGSLALVPTRCDKGTGLRTAMAELDVAAWPVLAIGDATNDLPMFAMATIAVAVANADDSVRDAGVLLTDARGGLGVAEALRRFAPHRS